MLFASLINHLAAQQIREPHGNLISHGKGGGGGTGQERAAVGIRAESGRATLFYSSAAPPPHSPSHCSAERWSKVWELREGLHLKSLPSSALCSVNMLLCL